ncbi:MAG: methenyltetrahydromethanopterin cyclohydrolase [Alphaproteobacteria bacterium GM202ARS2]|nr:methenyltetrahydromethanopterin cyclohydrolase [Alphaproteobacteria bacterium GM202ARS2]
MTPTIQSPDVGLLVQPLVEKLIDEKDSLRVKVDKGAMGCTLIDCGIDTAGGLEAGLLVARICMGGLGTVALTPCPSIAKNWSWHISVHSRNPVLACLASQYAGWNLSTKGYNALASGPGRALAAREELFKELAYTSNHSTAVLVLEVDKPPPEELVEKVTRDCGVKGNQLYFVLTPTSSLAGTVQIVARCLEVALHKAHALEFPLSDIVDGVAHAPLPPPSNDFITGMGRTNDAIIYGGNIQLFVKGSDGAAETLANTLPSCNSKDYGKPFSEIFTDNAGDFYKIDPSLFSPARVVVANIDSGNSFHAGAIDEAVLDRSFGKKS